MRQYETYKCSMCGNEVEVQVVGGGILKCCDKEMECITKNLTPVNLMKAFAGESQARNKYEFFAEIAREEGLHKIARFFQEAADNEKYHAQAELKAYNKLVNGIDLDSTIKNLQYAADGEKYEHTVMYPNFASIAKEENLKDIARLLSAIGKVEVEHEAEYLALKQALIDEGFFKSEQDEYYVCEVCGYVHKGKKPPKACPLCKAPDEYFKKRCKVITAG